MRSRSLRFGVALIGLLVGAELATRMLLGLGDPVLYVADREIEYMMKPNQDITRLGRRIVVNSYGMRSETFAPEKASPDELRVLVMGDSVVNGGNRIDQSQLATTQLQRLLAQSTGRPVVVGNVSAGSWGPQNLLAWTQRFGLLQADVVVIVLSSHDASDIPTFAPLDPVVQPSVRPTLALSEGLSAVMHRIKMRVTSSAIAPAEVASERRPPADAALDSLRRLIQQAGDARTCVTVLGHFTQTELTSGPGPGHDALRGTATATGAAVFDDKASLVAAQRQGTVPYRDNIHLSESGQSVLARVLTEAVGQCRRPTGRDVTAS